MTKEDLRNKYNSIILTKYYEFNKESDYSDKALSYIKWLEDEYCKLEAKNFLLQCENK